MNKILIIANDESTILNFRKEIIQAFVEEKFQVIVCYPLGEHTSDIQCLGCEIAGIKVNRHGKSIFQDFKLLRTCIKLIKKYRPDVVLTYTVKPNVYASLACQLTKTRYINNITGLGSVLQTTSFLSKIVLVLQKIAYKKSSYIFFQNKDNYEKLKEHKVITEETPVKFIPGSGVNLEKQIYEEFPINDGIRRFIIVSRIRKDKGYGEFLEAAKSIKERKSDVEFHVVGWYEEESLSSIVEEYHNQEIIVYHGAKRQEEVHKLIASCNCLIHPSYHEGMANVLLEAAATGRPVIATNIPGCKETFEEEVTGYGCKVKDTASLEAAIEKMLDVPYEKQVEMGKLARKKMEKEFDRKFVAQIYIDTIKELEKKG